MYNFWYTYMRLEPGQQVNVFTSIGNEQKKGRNTETGIAANEFNQTEEQKVYVTKFLIKYGENVGETFCAAKSVIMNSTIV